MSDFDPLVRPANRTPQTGKLIEGLDTSTSLLGSGAADAPVSAGLGSVPVTATRQRAMVQAARKRALAGKGLVESGQVAPALQDRAPASMVEAMRQVDAEAKAKGVELTPEVRDQIKYTLQRRMLTDPAVRGRMWKGAGVLDSVREAEKDAGASKIPDVREMAVEGKKGLSEALATTAGVQFKKLPPSVRLALGGTVGKIGAPDYTPEQGAERLGGVVDAPGSMAAGMLGLPEALAGLASRSADRAKGNAVETPDLQYQNLGTDIMKFLQKAGMNPSAIQGWITGLSSTPIGGLADQAVDVLSNVIPPNPYAPGIDPHERGLREAMWAAVIAGGPEALHKAKAMGRQLQGLGHELIDKATKTPADKGLEEDVAAALRSGAARPGRTGQAVNAPGFELPTRPGASEGPAAAPGFDMSRSPSSGGVPDLSFDSNAGRGGGAHGQEGQQEGRRQEVLSLPMQRGMVPIEKVGVHPDLQYKTSEVQDRTNNVSNAMKGIDVYKRGQGGVWGLWQDKEGNLFAGNAHHRRELANRASQFVDETVRPGEDVPVPREVPAYILHEADGWTPQMARQHFALENIRDGKGTAFDAVNVLREMGIDGPGARDFFDKQGITISNRLSKQIDGIMQLPPEAMNLLSKLNPEYVAGVGRVSGLTSLEQMKVLEKAASKEIGDRTQTMQQGEMQAALARGKLYQIRDEGSQGGLFGEDEAFTQTLEHLDKAAEIGLALRRLLANVRKDLIDLPASRFDGEIFDEATRGEKAAKLGQSQKQAQDTVMDVVEKDTAFRDKLETEAKRVLDGHQTVGVAAKMLLPDLIGAVEDARANGGQVRKGGGTGVEGVQGARRNPVVAPGSGGGGGVRQADPGGASGSSGTAGRGAGVDAQGAQVGGGSGGGVPEGVRGGDPSAGQAGPVRDTGGAVGGPDPGAVSGASGSGGREAGAGQPVRSEVVGGKISWSNKPKQWSAKPPTMGGEFVGDIATPEGTHTLVKDGSGNFRIAEAHPKGGHTGRISEPVPSNTIVEKSPLHVSATQTVRRFKMLAEAEGGTNPADAGAQGAVSGASSSGGGEAGAGQPVRSEVGPTGSQANTPEAKVLSVVPAESIVPPKGSGAKEPWQMTREEFASRRWPHRVGGDDLVTVYHGGDGPIEPGKWVTRKKSYAKLHADAKGRKVYSAEVPASDLAVNTATSGRQDELLYRPWDGSGPVAQLGDKYATFDELRRHTIEQALKDGKPVPPEVLADYPDLPSKSGPDGPKHEPKPGVFKSGEDYVRVIDNVPGKPNTVRVAVTDAAGRDILGKDEMPQYRFVDRRSLGGPQRGAVDLKTLAGAAGAVALATGGVALTKYLQDNGVQPEDLAPLAVGGVGLLAAVGLSKAGVRIRPTEGAGFDLGKGALTYGEMGRRLQDVRLEPVSAKGALGIETVRSLGEDKVSALEGAMKKLTGKSLREAGSVAYRVRAKLPAELQPHFDRMYHEAATRTAKQRSDALAGQAIEKVVDAHSQYVVKAAKDLQEVDRIGQGVFGRKDWSNDPTYQEWDPKMRHQMEQNVADGKEWSDGLPEPMVKLHEQVRGMIERNIVDEADKLGMRVWVKNDGQGVQASKVQVGSKLKIPGVAGDAVVTDIVFEPSTHKSNVGDPFAIDEAKIWVEMPDGSRRALLPGERFGRPINRLEEFVPRVYSPRFLDLLRNNKDVAFTKALGEAMSKANPDAGLSGDQMAGMLVDMAQGLSDAGKPNNARSFFASLERERLLDVSPVDWTDENGVVHHVDPWEGSYINSMAQYVDKANKRLAITTEFGTDGAALSKILDAVSRTDPQVAGYLNRSIGQLFRIGTEAQPSKMGNVAKGEAAAQSLSKLGMGSTQLAQAGDLIMPLIHTGGVRVAKAIWKGLTDSAAHNEAALLAGVDNSWMRDLHSGMEDVGGLPTTPGQKAKAGLGMLATKGERIAGMSKLADAWMSAIGVRGLDRIVRGTAMMALMDDAKGTLAQAISGKGTSTQVRRAMDYFGPEALTDAKRVGVDAYVSDPKVQARLAQSIKENYQYTGAAADNPAWMSHPAGAIFMRFKKPVVVGTRFLLNSVVGEAAKGNYAPVARAVVYGVGGGTAITALKNLASLQWFDDDARKDLLHAAELVGKGESAAASALAGHVFGKAFGSVTEDTLMDAERWKQLTGPGAGPALKRKAFQTLLFAAGKGIYDSGLMGVFGEFVPDYNRRVRESRGSDKVDPADALMPVSATSLKNLGNTIIGGAENAKTTGWDEAYASIEHIMRTEVAPVKRLLDIAGTRTDLGLARQGEAMLREKSAPPFDHMVFTPAEMRRYAAAKAKVDAQKKAHAGGFKPESQYSTVQKAIGP